MCKHGEFFVRKYFHSFDKIFTTFLVSEGVEVMMMILTSVFKMVVMTLVLVLVIVVMLVVTVMITSE